MKYLLPIFFFFPFIASASTFSMAPNPQTLAELDTVNTTISCSGLSATDGWVLFKPDDSTDGDFFGLDSDCVAASGSPLNNPGTFASMMMVGTYTWLNVNTTAIDFSPACDTDRTSCEGTTAYLGNSYTFNVTPNPVFSWPNWYNTYSPGFASFVSDYHEPILWFGSVAIFLALTKLVLLVFRGFNIFMKRFRP